MEHDSDVMVILVMGNFVAMPSRVLLGLVVVSSERVHQRCPPLGHLQLFVAPLKFLIRIRGGAGCIVFLSLMVAKEIGFFRSPVLFMPLTVSGWAQGDGWLHGRCGHNS